METYGCGDSFLIRDAVSTASNEDDNNSTELFATLLNEIEWCEMLHRGSPGKEIDYFCHVCIDTLPPS